MDTPKPRLKVGGSRNTLGAFRKALWEEHGGVCGICGEAVGFVEMQIDHVIPVSLGGDDDWDNLQPAHRGCNIAKGGKNRGTQIPDRVRVMREPVTLDDADYREWLGPPRPAPISVPMDPLLWQQLKTEARRHDWSAGALLNLIVDEWLAEHQCAAAAGGLSVRSVSASAVAARAMASAAAARSPAA